MTASLLASLHIARAKCAMNSTVHTQGRSFAADLRFIYVHCTLLQNSHEVIDMGVGTSMFFSQESQ